MPDDDQNAHNGYVRWFEDLSSDDTALVGGKNASLGEMISALKEHGVRVPDGFALTAHAYRAFIEHNDLAEPIRERLGRLDGSERSLRTTGRAVRQMITRAPFPDDVAAALENAYAELAERTGEDEPGVAARSSATAEDLPSASFAGQLESFLNVTGADDLRDACRACFASLFTDRAVSYREGHGFDHMRVALSLGVQKMVRSDTAGAGVMFSIDTETGFPNLIVINAAWGLGDNVVSGAVVPRNVTFRTDCSRRSVTFSTPPSVRARPASASPARTAFGSVAPRSGLTDAPATRTSGVVTRRSAAVRSAATVREWPARCPVTVTSPPTPPTPTGIRNGTLVSLPAT